MYVECVVDIFEKGGSSFHYVDVKEYLRHEYLSIDGTPSNTKVESVFYEQEHWRNLLTSYEMFTLTGHLYVAKLYVENRIENLSITYTSVLQMSKFQVCVFCFETRLLVI